MKLTRHILYDILRNRIVIAYTAFLFITSLTLFQLEEDNGKAVLSLLNIILIVVPMITMIFATIHYYNSYEFIELMLAQPISRAKILLSEYAGVAASLIGAIWLGLGMPVVIFAAGSTGMAMLFTATALTLAFSSIAFLAAVTSRDKAKGIGLALLLWFYFALIYDGLVMMILFSFSDYPMEKFTLLLSSLNPVDLGRIFIMLQMDVSAMMGYTGALYKEFFGSVAGLFFTMGIMLLWIILPLMRALAVFRRKDI